MKLFSFSSFTAFALVLTLVVSVSAKEYTLISTGQIATASSYEGYGLEPSNVTDGDLTTRWSSSSHEWEWVMIDLGEDKSVDKLVLHWEGAFAAEYNVFVAKHGTQDWGAPVFVQHNGQGSTEEYTQEFGTGRYVAIQSIRRATPYGVSLFEVEVYSENSSNMVWLGELTVAPVEAEEGNTYYNTIIGAFFIYSKEGWMTFTQKGDTGSKGAKGDKGDTGAQGVAGAQGPQGPTGAIPDLSQLLERISRLEADAERHVAPFYFVDPRDDKSYEAIQIGSQVWMAQNLNLETLNSWCYADDDAKCNVYGRIYDWESAMSGSSSSNATPSGVQGVCPANWHLPSLAEWAILYDYIDANNGDVRINKNLKAAVGWHSNDFDNFGFSALPGGYRNSNGSFYGAGNLGGWWSATEFSSANAWYKSLDNINEHFSNINVNKPYGFSVRCIQNTP
ncbi:MAG: discoidin domain-containing protein [Fibrobacterales bacterium]